MATEADKYEGYRKKLEGICDENGLLYQLSTKGYPFTLTIRPQQGLDAQISMLEQADEKPFNSPDGTIQFFMEDGDLIIKTSERFTIGDALFSKLRRLFVNLHFTFLQMFHRDVCEKGLLRAAYEPAEGSDNKKLTEPLEEFDEEPPDDDDELPDFPDDLIEEPKAIPLSDWLIKEATVFVRQQNTVSVDMLRKKFNLGFAESAKLVEALEDAGVIGGYNGSGPREVLPHAEPAADG